MVAPRHWLRACAPISFFVLQALAVDSDFSFYPTNSQSCLNQASKDSSCNGQATVAALNKCLCGNGDNFIINAATCLGKKDPNDVATVYTTMSGACQDSDTPMTVSQSEFYAAANGDASTTSTQPTSATSTSTSEPTNTKDSDKDDDSSSSLPMGAIIGIAVGGAAVGIAAIAGLVIFLIRRKRRRGEESHPMLPQFASMYGAPTTFPPTEPSPNFETETKPAWAKGMSPSPSPAHTVSPNPSSLTGWGSPQQGWTGSNVSRGSYAGAYATPETVAELPPQTAMASAGTTHVFEMDGVDSALTPGDAKRRTGRFVEMQGSEPSSHFK